MINWEELKHIHVIRKLDEILAQWFHTDIFFVDELLIHLWESVLLFSGPVVLRSTGRSR